MFTEEAYEKYKKIQGFFEDDESSNFSHLKEDAPKWAKEIYEELFGVEANDNEIIFP